MNTQPVEKIITTETEYLSVHSIFPTIQGEGPFVGQPAIFVRLAGCNLQCPQCDTDYTQNRHIMTANEIFSKIEEKDVNDNITPQLVVITGGEPLRQNLNNLITLLLQTGYRVQIETNGTTDGGLFYIILRDPGFTIVCSPKTGSINKRLIPHITALKYVISHDSVSGGDGLPIKALEHPNSPMLARPPSDFVGTVYVQPADVKEELINQKNLKTAIDSCMTFGYTLGIQMHKLIGME